MNIIEVGKVLATVRVSDARFPVDHTDDEADARLVAWHTLIGEHTYADAETAVIDYYRTGRFPIQPADIYERCRKVELARLAAAQPIDYPSELDGDRGREQAYRLTWQGHVKRGVPGPTAYKLTDAEMQVQRRELVGPPPGLRKQLTAAIAARTVR